MITIREALAEAREQLASEPTARLDAEVLLAHELGVDRAFFYANADKSLTRNQVEAYRESVRRRRQGEPVAYITGRREFWSLDLEITPDVLIPRPDTETLVECALRLIPERSAWRVADLGTGSGAIALAIAHERPHCEVHAVDASAAALGVARKNALRLGLDRIHFHEGDWTTPLRGRFSLLASNPPYVATGDPHLDSGDCRFEPRAALSPDGDAMDCLRAIADQAIGCLEPGGWLLLEHGHTQGDAVRRLLERLDYGSIETAPDLAGNERVTIARMAG